MIRILAVCSIALAASAQAAATVHSTDAEFRTGSGDGNVVIGAGDADGSVRLAKQAGTLGAWGTAGNLPFAWRAIGSWTRGGRAWLIGGYAPGLTDTVMSLDFAGDGSLAAATPHSKLPLAAHHGGVAVWGRWLYVGLGNSSALTGVYRAELDSTGAPSNWALASGFPSGLTSDGNIRLAADYGRLVWVSGYPNGAFGTATYSAPIRADGSLGTWQAEDGRDYNYSAFGLAWSMGRLFSLGGENATWAGRVEVNVVDFSAAGALGTWSPGTSMPAPRSYFGSSELGWAGKLFQVGGKHYSGGNIIYSSVYSCPLSAGGAMGAWAAESSLPALREGHALFAVGGGLYAVGGTTNASTPENTVYRAALNQGGANSAQGVYINAFDLGTDQPLQQLAYTVYPYQAGSLQLRTALNGQPFGGWTSADDDGLISLTWTARHVEYRVLLKDVAGQTVRLERVQLHAQATATATPTPSGARVHANAADFAKGSGDGHVEITSAGGLRLMKRAGALGAWAYKGDLPQGGLNIGWADGRRIYAGSGTVSDAPTVFQANVYMAEVDASGDLGPWRVAGAVPASRSGMGVARWREWVYAGGGWDASATQTGLWRSRIAADGSLGAWASVTSLPVSDGSPRLAAAQGRLYYAVGKQNGSTYLASVYAAPILSDGSLGSFALLNNRVQAVDAVHLDDAADGLYSLGGETSLNGWAGNDYVQRADYGPAGLGAWSLLAQSLPLARSYLSPAESDTAGKLFVLGGKTGAASPPAAHSSAYAAAFNSDGSLQAWSSEASLPVGRHGGLVAGAGDRLWYLGGAYPNTAYPRAVSIYAAPLNQGADNASLGIHRNGFDLGSDQSVLQLQATLTAGTPATAVKARVRSAADGGAWSAWSALAQPPISINASVRHVEYELVLSDPGSGVAAGVDRVELSGPTATPVPTSEIDRYKAGPFKGAEGEATAFPNPAKGAQAKFGFELRSSGRCTLTVWTAAGVLASQVGDSFGPGKGLLRVNIKDYAPGVYLYQLVIEHDDGRKVTGPVKRFVVAP